MNSETFENVWDAVEPAAEQAEHLRLRAALMRAVRQRIVDEGWTQIEAAGLLGVTQPRISDLMRGKLSLFSLDSLVGLAVAAGLRVHLTVDRAA